MISKRGSHVGMIASFAIFILFLIAIYFIIQPTVKGQKDKQLILDYLKLKVQDQFSANLTTVIVSNSSINPSNCINFKKSDSGMPNGSFYAKDKNENAVLSANDGFFWDINWSGNQNFVKIFASEEKFSSGIFSCMGTSPNTNYTIKSITKEKQIFETKIIYGITNFQNLKANVTIPQGNEWSMDFEYANGSIISAGNASTLREVYSEELDVTYIDRNASSMSGKLRIRVW